MAEEILLTNVAPKVEEVPASLASTVYLKSSIKFSTLLQKSLIIGHLYIFDLEIRSRGALVDVEIKPRNSVPRYTVKLNANCADKEPKIYDFNEKIIILTGIPCKNFELRFAIEFSPNYLTERSFIADIKKHFSTSVRLISSNGVVETNKELLTIRSPVFKAMFDNDTMEAEALQVSMKTFNKETLEAFDNFLVTDSIENVEKTALDLFILGDQYDIPLLKTKAGAAILNNLSEQNFEQVISWILKLQPELTKEAVKNYYVEGKKMEVSKGSDI
ncbi:uncharacterized protein LOC119079684 [Bradysia coprophila]|uniref:uncharacterized protein LOC119079684 n=1 Tax=Bradysia coprophila TaxID=38358 RepID=UPI00187D7AFE|nr:uncharacterized protein LOC119079684 [Bradysia coprophila]